MSLVQNPMKSLKLNTMGLKNVPRCLYIILLFLLLMSCSSAYSCLTIQQIFIKTQTSTNMCKKLKKMADNDHSRTI